MGADRLRDVEEGRAASSPSRENAPKTLANSTEKKGVRLYNVLGIQQDATEEEIKKAYRKLALRYHPDKNLDGNPEKTEMFKKINYANGVLSNPNKRRVYDEMGDRGLELMERLGEHEYVLMWFLNPWFIWTFIAIGILTCGFFFCFCCCFCCGKYKKEYEDEVFSDEDESDEEVIVDQPTTSDSTSNQPPITKAIVMFPPSKKL